MIEIINFFANILSYVISPIYNFVGNYGIAVILFTVIVKVLLIPLGIKQQKTTVKTKMVRPELEKIQAKYKNDKEKLNEETMKLYQKYGINPMGGCLPLLVQLPILLGLYRVIQEPITWIMRMAPSAAIEKLIESGKISATEAVTKLTSLAEDATKVAGMTNISDIINNLGTKVTQINIASEFDLINFNLLGLDLSKTPDISHISLLWLVPILATGAAFFSNWVSSKLNPMSPEQAQQMKTMNMMMPLMTAFFTFTLSAGIGVYWFASTMLSVLQMYLLTKFFEKKIKPEDFVSDKKGKGKK